MKQYIEFHNRNIYHVTYDGENTLCNISAPVADDQFQEYAETDYPLPVLVNVPSKGRKICPKCAAKDIE